MADAAQPVAVRTRGGRRVGTPAAALRAPDEYTDRQYLDALASKVVVFDGAMGTELQRRGLTAADFGGEQYAGCNDYLVLQKPEVVEAVHASYLDAGCDVIETCTFRSNRLTLAEYGLAPRAAEINRAAATLARRVADRFAARGQRRFVAGSIGPSGKLPSSSDPELSRISFDELADVFAEQAEALITGDCDLLLVETSQDILEVKATLMGIQDAFARTGRRIPVQVQVTLDPNGRMLLGTDIGAVLATLERMRVDVLGINCSTGPDDMRGPLAWLGEHSSIPISCLPNAGLPINVDGQAVYPLQAADFAREMADFAVRFGLNAAGGCCGTTPDHIRQLAGALAGVKPRRRTAAPLPAVSSGITTASLIQDPKPMLIGERLNAQGSKKMKEMLLAEDYDGVAALAREQMDGGAHTLDICVAMTERRDEVYLMSQVVRKLSQTVEAPLVIDTTEPEVLEVALEAAPGRVIVNAINMENGRQRLDAMLPLIRDYGAATIALTIDEHGMARTADRKLEAARKIYDIATGEYGLRPDALIFDALTFTLATGDPESANTAVETLAGIRRIKAELPGVLTSLGVSNVSYGFKPAARWVLNSVFLYHAVEAGLDMAIVNPKQVTPYPEIPAAQRELAEDLLLNRRPDAAARFISYFEGAKARQATAGDPMAGMAPAQRLHWRILHRQPDGCEADVDTLVSTGVRDITGIAEFTRQPGYRYPNPDTSAVALRVLNEVLLPAMKEVGDKFGAGELILPFVLQSAEAMKKAVSHLERYLERTEGAAKGTIVLATVYGDVHDIGKNLIKTILANNGYRVHDLGKQVPVNDIVNQAVDLRADAIGLSALLVSTSRQMPLVVRELDRRSLSIPGTGGRRRDQPRLRPRHQRRRRGSRLPGRRALLPGRLRRPRDGGPPGRPGVTQGTARTRAPHRRGATPTARGGHRRRGRALVGHRHAGGRPAAAVLGRPGGPGHAAGRGLPAPERDPAVPGVMGRREQAGRGMERGARAVRGAPRAHEGGSHRTGMAGTAGGVRVLPRPLRRQRRDRVQSRDPGSGRRAVVVPAAEGRRSAVPGGLLHARRIAEARRRRAAGRDGGRRRPRNGSMSWMRRTRIARPTSHMASRSRPPRRRPR